MKRADHDPDGEMTAMLAITRELAKAPPGERRNILAAATLCAGAPRQARAVLLFMERIPAERRLPSIEYLAGKYEEIQAEEGGGDEGAA